MRILHVIPSLDPASGGPPIVATRLAAAQAASGHDVACASYQSLANADAVQAFLKSLPHGQLVRQHYLPPQGRLERVVAANARRRAAALVRGRQIVHLHGVWDPVVRAFAAACTAGGVPYVLTPHGMLDPWSLKQSALKKQIALRLGYRAMLNGARFLHTLNRDEADLLAPLKLRPPTVTIANGIFLEELLPLPPAGGFYERFPALQGRPYVLFLSRLHFKKGLDILADAFAVVAGQHETAQLVVAGPDEGARPAFVDRIARLGLADRCHVVGPLYGLDKYRAFVDAACFCLPSRQEGFSIAITEALACGVPCVISTNCHFPEVAEAGAGYVVSLTPQAVAASLLQVLNDPSAKPHMTAAGQKMVTARYTWPAISSQMLAAYEGAVVSRG